ncbi:hypothetical protein PU71_10085 [Escherichia coli]|nr:hypothetical protein PU73_03500 [Escherichia coli]KHH03768.1 hypothetical protein PU71_10085 [Escherichia coli]
MRPPFHLIFQLPGLIPFSQQKGLRVQKRVHFSPNQINHININMINKIFNSSPAPLFIRPRCKAGLFHFLATVDFWPLQSIIYWLVFFAFSRMFVTFIHLSTL